MKKLLIKLIKFILASVFLLVAGIAAMFLTALVMLNLFYLIPR